MQMHCKRALGNSTYIMSMYDSDSDDDKFAVSTRFFGRERPLKEILGNGIVADIILWKNKYVSAGILIGFSIIWLLFEVEEYHLVTLLCHLLILFLLIFCVWSNCADLIQWKPPTIREITLPESTFRLFFEKLNKLLLKSYDISTGKDLKAFLLTIASLWILSSFGSLFNSSLTFLYIAFLCLSTIPVMLEKYEKQVNASARKINRSTKDLFNKFNSNFLDKIPRGPKKDKKVY